MQMFYLLHYNCNIKYNYISISKKDTCNKILWFYNPVQHSSLVTVEHHRTGKGLGWWISSLLILLANSKVTSYFICHRGINFWNNVAGSQKIPAAPELPYESWRIRFFYLGNIMLWQGWGIDSIFQAESRNPSMLYHSWGTKQGPLLHRCKEAKAVGYFNYCSEEWNQAIFCNISLQLPTMFVYSWGFNQFNLAFQLWNKSTIHRRNPQLRKEHKKLSWNNQILAS